MPKIVLLLSLIIIASVPAQAQFFQNTKQPAAPGNTTFKRETRKDMDKNITLPDVPLYPGAKFVSGEQAEPSERIVCACTVHYLTPKDSQSQVMSFYANAFNGGGWRINQQTSYSIDASNNANNSHCHISVGIDEKNNGKLEINYASTPKVN